MRVGENTRKTEGKTRILHFRKRPGVKKKEVKRQKIGSQKGERNLAPKRSQNGSLWAPQSAPNRSKKRLKKSSRKRCLKKVLTPHRTAAGEPRGNCLGGLRLECGPAKLKLNLNLKLKL